MVQVKSSYKNLDNDIKEMSKEIFEKEIKLNNKYKELGELNRMEELLMK